MRQKTLALYIRLSKEDDDVGISSEKEESNSITNQRMLLYDYLKSHPEFQDYRIIEKCDDGYSGKKFDRPQFVELMELVRQREVDCILVKDFSRFGRDYIEIGDYLEQLFPFLGVRFIAVNDQYDSAKNTDSVQQMAVFKNVFNDFYAADASAKVRTSLNLLKRQGKFLGRQAPYGYRIDPADRYHLLVDEETASVVRRIFGKAGAKASSGASGHASRAAESSAPTQPRSAESVFLYMYPTSAARASFTRRQTVS